MDEIMFPGSGKGRRRTGKGQSLPTAAQREQEDLFAKPATAKHVGPVARTSDPETSHTAARKAGRRLGMKQLAVLHLFQQLHAFGPPFNAITDERLVQEYEGDWRNVEPMTWYPTQADSGLRTRRNELVTLGYVEDSGSRGETSHGGASVRWRLTPSGLAFNVDAERERLARAATRQQHEADRRNAGEP